MIKKKKGKEPNSERWMLTYVDLITLLLVFFIILYSFSNIDKQKYEQIAKSLNQAMGSSSGTGTGAGKGTGIGGTGILDGGTGFNSAGGDSTDSKDQQTLPFDADVVETTQLTEIKTKVDNMFSQAGLQNSVQTTIEDRGLVISIKNALLFDSGSADIKSQYMNKLVDIGKLLKSLNNFIIVEGNADNMPISDAEYKDNWDLASARAVNVMRVLINDSGLPANKLSAKTNGEYKPVASNNTEAGRAQNRRVDILILNTKYNSVENSMK